MVLPISPSLLVGAVQATIDVYNAAGSAAAQQVRDANRFAIDANAGGILLRTEPEAVNATFRNNAEARKLFEGNEKRLQAWEKFLDQDFSDIDILLEARREYELAHKYGGLTPAQIEQLAFGERLRQWAEDDPTRPLDGWERFAVSLADVAFGFVAANPAILGVGGNGEKLIGAFAGTIAELIPADGDFGPRQRFGERVLGVVLRAGLQTFADNPALAFREDHLQALVGNIAGPLIESFDGNSGLAGQVNWQRAADALLGPAAAAAFTTVAAHQTAFLGRNFATEEAAGALTRSLLLTAAKRPVDGIFTRDSALAFYSAALNVVAERPDLFLGKPQDKQDAFLNDLVGRVSGVLAARDDAFNGELGVAIAVTALDSLKDHAPGLINVAADANWESVFDKAMVQVIDGLRTDIVGGDASTLLSAAQLTGLARIVLEQVARTPRMLVGDTKEVETIVAAMARAMAKDDRLLLSGDDWLEIAAVAAREAAANPGRLFGFTPDTPGGHIGETAIRQILNATAADLSSARQSGDVLFGDTLKQAIETTLRAMSGNLAGARQALGNDRLAALILQLNRIAATKADDGLFAFGAKEYLALYRHLLSRLLADGSIETLVGDDGKLTAAGRPLIERILAGLT